ncbi:TMEM175 family protein [Dactylosporangium sp. CA-092794]|uniref:TMEM175 family protein n=1 Tax=Dactylosporangium sp. CA-092794 TaxID=3239929 RepID=UPI003D9017F5
MRDDSAGEPAPPGLTPERVGFFTDALFAIAMTLLVIEIPRPESEAFQVGEGVSKAQAAEHLWSFLIDQASSFYAYFLAFFMLWIVWRQHHVLLDRVQRVSKRMVAWHFPLLLLVGFLPYPTTVLGHYPDNPLAALLYGLVVAALLLCRSVIQSEGYRGELLRPHVDPGTVRTTVIVSWIITGYWAATVGLVWWLTAWMQLAWYLSPLAAALAGRLIDRRPRVAGPGLGRELDTAAPQPADGQ